MAVISVASTRSLRIKSMGLSLGKKESTALKPLMLEIFTLAFSFLCLKKCHMIATGSSKSNQKNCGLANSIPSNMIIVF